MIHINTDAVLGFRHDSLSLFGYTCMMIVALLLIIKNQRGGGHEL